MKIPRPGRGDKAMARLCMRRWKLFLVFLPTLLAGCASTVTTGPFVEVKRIEGLHRGSSTAADVRRLLGPPTGMGQAVLPTDPHSHEVWLYDDIEITDIRDLPQGLSLNMRQQVLLVFFRKGAFDGFMWFSNAVATKER